MPIIQKGESKQLEFGYGDIEVFPGLLKIEEVVGVVAFTLREEPTAIGQKTIYEGDKLLKLGETPVRMIFNKVESIDVVIRALEEAKRMMLQRRLQ